MSSPIPIDRVRRREDSGPELFDSDKQQFSRKQAKLDQQASMEVFNPEDEDESRKPVSEPAADAAAAEPDEAPGRSS
ncbi:MAG TPA: hypothetical protein VFP05_16330 [Thermomicrobiales bacterium]|nr:hypothetical protein [Thermomicrobiales bacterium]